MSRQDGRDRLDDDFLGVEHAVDHDAEGVGADLGDDDEALRGVDAAVLAELEHVVQADERQQAVAQAQERGIVDPLDRRLGTGRRAHEFEHADLRDREPLARAFDDERRHDGERQRDLDDEAGALAALELELDRTADLLDVGAHDVHAHAAPRDRGDDGGGGEAGLEDELRDLLVGERGRLGLAAHAVLDGLLLDLVDVETAAVVRDLDDDVAAFVEGVEVDAARLGFAGRTALFGPFEAVVGAVAHEMRQRVLDELEHLAVELGVLAVHLQVDLLAQFVAEIADEARQLRPGIADRLHARLHDAFLQFGRDVVEALERARELAVLLRAQDLQELVARQHELGNHRHQVLEDIHIDADRRGGDGGFDDIAARLGLRDGLGRRGCRGDNGGRHGRRGGFRGFLGGERVGDGGRLVGRHGHEAMLVGLGFGRIRGRKRLQRHGRGGGRRRLAVRVVVEALDQVCVVAFGFRFGLFENRQQALDPVEGLEDQRDGLFVGDQLAVADLVEQVLARMRDLLEARQAEEAACALDGVHDAEDAADQARIVRVLLELDDLGIQDTEVLVRLGEEVAQQIVHVSLRGRSAIGRSFAPVLTLPKLPNRLRRCYGRNYSQDVDLAY